MQKNVIFDFFDIWSLNYWPKVNSEDMLQTLNFNSYRFVKCVLLLTSTVSELYENYWTNVIKLENLTFDDLWWPQFWPERFFAWNSFETIFSELSNGVFCFSLRAIETELVGGVFKHPPPGTRKVAPSTGTARVKRKGKNKQRSRSRSGHTRSL